MVDNLHRCMGCMEPIDGSSGVCPNCGYADGTPHLPAYLAPGTALNDRYVVGRLLKYNGESAVYLGFDTVTENKVTVREYMPDTLCSRLKNSSLMNVQQNHLVQYKAYMSEFTELNKTLAKMRTLNHISSAVDMFAENNTTYAVFPYLEGMPLSQYLEAHGGRFTWEEVKKYFPPLFTTASLIHNAGLVHRGISPETIFVTTTGEMKLTDFAISAERTANSELAPELFAGYAAPEQYSANSWQGTWTDVYGISAILYRLLTGMAPADAVVRIGNDVMPSPSEVDPEIPENVSAVIMEGLSLSSDSRIQTITELVTKLFEHAEPPRRQPVPEQRTPSQKSAPARRKSTSGKYIIPIAVGLTTLLILGAVALMCLKMMGYELPSKNSGVTEPETPATIYTPPVTESAPEVTAPIETIPEETLLLKNFVGTVFELIKDSDTYKDFLIFKPEAEYNDTVPKGQIFEQSIPEGTAVPRGTEIEVKVSLGPKNVVVPDWFGMTEKEYIALLDEAGIKYSIEYVIADGFMNGYVCGTSKEPDDTIDVSEGETLIVEVCDNPESSDLIGTFDF